MPILLDCGWNPWHHLTPTKQPNQPSRPTALVPLTAPPPALRRVQLLDAETERHLTTERWPGLRRAKHHHGYRYELGIAIGGLIIGIW